MKWLLIPGALLFLSGCAAAPRCDGHLTPINHVTGAQSADVASGTAPVLRPSASRAPRDEGRP